MFRYCLIPFLLTTFVSIFSHILPKSLLSIELVLRIYFSLFTSFVYIVVMYINLLAAKHFTFTRQIFIFNIISMINYMNGKTFIKDITTDSNQFMLDSVIFMLYAGGNLLTINYIITNKLLKNNYQLYGFDDANNVDAVDANKVDANNVDANNVDANNIDTNNIDTVDANNANNVDAVDANNANNVDANNVDAVDANNVDAVDANNVDAINIDAKIVDAENNLKKRN